jgi:ribosomal protein S11
VVHIQSTFNNTIITITDVSGTSSPGRRRRARLQGQPEVDALRRAGRGR